MDGLVTVYVFPSTAVVSDEKYQKKEENQCYVISSTKRSGVDLKLRLKGGALIGRKALYKGDAYKVFFSTEKRFFLAYLKMKREVDFNVFGL